MDANCFHYNSEHDWLIELSDNKLSDNNLASELVENRSFLAQSQPESHTSIQLMTFLMSLCEN